MNDRNIDEILDRAAAPQSVDSALLDRVSASMRATMRPVRPMAPAWMLASALLVTCAAIAAMVASILGLDGIRKLSGAETGAIFPSLGIFTWLAALAAVAAMTPGSLRWKNPLVMEPVMNNPVRLLLLIVAGFLALDAIFFHDYQMDSFFQQGIPCLRAGLIVAVPTGVAAWLVLRRGFAVNRTAAGLAAGTLAGLAGLAMLEMHCPNLHAIHIMLWHTAVIPISAIVGALLARLSPRSRRGL